MNSIKELREKIIEANRLYRELRKTVRIPDEHPYQSEGIGDLSEPFLKGVFTLAVIGEMSSGKSSFINALLEDQDLLPTGHEQTTCTLTEILWSENKKLIVTYADDHQFEYQGDDVLKTLKDVAAIPDKYESLPINHVNQYILQGVKEDDIVAKSEDLQKLTKTKIDEALLREYIQEKNETNIPTNVYLEYPLADSFRGWRIVDTPGIGALGGIEQTTKDFMSQEQVDAALFVFRGDRNVVGTGNYQIVETSYNELSDVAKERTFFVITHTGKTDCRNNLESIKRKALELFSEGDVAIPKERFFAVDSMLSLLHDIAIKEYGIDPCLFLGLDAPQLEGMSEKEVEEYMNMIYSLAREVKKANKELNSENLTAKICETAGFVKMKQTLGDFAREAKREAYNRVIATIIDDFRAFGSAKVEEQALWRSKITKTPEEFEEELSAKLREVKKYKTNLSDQFTKIRMEYTHDMLMSKFDNIMRTFRRKVSAATSNHDFKNAENDFQDGFPDTLGFVVQSFMSRCKDLQTGVQASFPSIAMQPIDFENAKKKAIKAATKTETYTVKVRKSGGWNLIKSLFGAASAYRTEDRTREVLDDSEALKNERNNIIEQKKAIMEAYCTQFNKVFIEPTLHDVNLQLADLVKTKENEYTRIKEDQSSMEDCKKEVDLIEKEHGIIIEKIADITTLKLVH